MPHSRFIDADGILITTLSGLVTMKELIELEWGLPSYIRDESFYELILHSDDVKVVIDRDESTTSSNTLKIVIEGLKKGAIAFVSDRDYIFALCRQLEMRVDNERIQVRVFRTEETARKWLHEIRSSNKADEGNG
jgi:hypothetical protein